MIPIGKLLRKKAPPTSSTVLSLDEQIALLERDLDSDSASVEEEGINGEDDDDEKHLFDVEKDESGSLVKLVSKSLLEHRIGPLPPSQLPSATCGFAGGGKHFESGQVKTASKVRFSDQGGEANKRARTSTNPVSHKPPSRSGIESAVRELMVNYVPSSVEHKPFWCRVCLFQGKDTTDLEVHKESREHKMKVAVEARLCSCGPCRKNFTSPEQLKEHLGGKLHRERMGFN
jgi:hypothetical protein